MKKILTWVDTGIVELNGDVSFTEVDAELGEYCLPVEPLSAKKTISQFIKEGGIGYNSLQNRTLGSSIFQLSSAFSAIKFTYGSKYKTLYNAGYPLHRIIEGSLFSKDLSEKFHQIEKVVLPVRKKEDVEVYFSNGHLDQFVQHDISDHASNVFFINGFGAKLMGLEGEGVVKTYLHPGEASLKSNKKIWEKRFLEDLVPTDHDAVKFLTMNSRLEQIYEVFNENSQGLFFVLRVYKGVLVLMSGNRTQLDTVAENIKQFPLTFRIITA